MHDDCTYEGSTDFEGRKHNLFDDFKKECVDDYLVKCHLYDGGMRFEVFVRAKELACVTILASKLPESRLKCEFETLELMYNNIVKVFLRCKRPCSKSGAKLLKHTPYCTKMLDQAQPCISRVGICGDGCHLQTLI